MNPHGCQLPWIGWRSWRVGFGMRNGWGWGGETLQRFSFSALDWGKIINPKLQKSPSRRFFIISRYDRCFRMLPRWGFRRRVLPRHQHPRQNGAERASFSLPNLIWKIVVEVTWSNNLVISFKFPFYHTLLPEIIRKSLLCSLQKGNIHSPDNLHPNTMFHTKLHHPWVTQVLVVSCNHMDLNRPGILRDCFCFWILGEERINLKKLTKVLEFF